MVIRSMSKRLLVTGKSGQLGQSIYKISAEFPALEITLVGRESVDLSQPESISAYFQENHYHTIINAAAYTAVDQAESEPQQAEQINHHAVAQLAEVASQQNSQLLQISTDYVFDGNNHKPYLESDSTSPKSIYGASKQRGEQAYLKVLPEGCIVRTSWLYSEFGNNFVKTMLRLGRERDQLTVVEDQVGSPTYATDLARVLLTIVDQELLKQSETEQPAIYHYANEGVCSWYDFAKAIFELSEAPCKVTPILSSQYPSPAARPHYSVLSKSAIRSLIQYPIPYWRSALKQCLQQLKQP